MNPIKLITALSISSLLSGCIVVANPISADFHIEKELTLEASSLSSLVAEVGAGSLKVKGVAGLNEIQVTADIYTDRDHQDNFEISLNEKSGRAYLIAKNKSKVIIKHDRSDALISTFLEAKKGDVILLAGKGHEVTQQIGSTMIPFSDRELAKRLTEEHS